MTYLTLNEVLLLHDRAISAYGGMPGVRDQAALDSCIALPKTAVYGVERFSKLEEKAAAYCFFIVLNHPFFDGNKRAGFMAALHFLLSNDIEPLFDENKAYEVISGVASGKAGIDDLVSLMREAVARSGKRLGDAGDCS